uniref:Putative hexamethylene bis-acetamide-inducible protein n=1 Tax=Culex tarsalis TaxID=7177 RepID=A0A1Q3FEX7_CULTA
MSAKSAENTAENRNFLASQNDVQPAPSATAAVTAAELTGALLAAPERTSSASAAPATTTVVDEAGIARSSSGGGGPNEKRRSNDGAKRKTRRGKAKRGKRSSSSRPYTKSQWKFQNHARIGAALANKRRAESLSDHPPLVPYNTNRFLMEDHMPQVLTPSGRTRDSSFSIDSEENYFYSLPEDEEEFLTKEFSSVYEDARSERLEGLSKTQLIQEYLQLEANFEQVTRRFAAKASSAGARDENESSAAPAIEGGGGGRRLEDRIRELMAENLELRRQLEHASRIGMVLSAKSSPRPHAAAGVERMDSSSCSSSEDSESDSSSSSSSSSGGSSSSSMSDDDDDGEDGAREVEDRQPLVAMMDGGEGEPNGFHQLNGGGVLEEDAIPLENGNGGDFNGAVSPLSSHSINSPPPPLVMN